MKNSNLAKGVGLGLALAFATAGAASAKLNDGVQLHAKGVDISFLSSDEEHEFFTSDQAFVKPAGFLDATIFLTRPGETSSDAFTLTQVTGHVNVFFISDGASALQQSLFVTVPRQFSITETGGWQDVSAFYGQPAGFALVLSDIDVPEPGAWALMLLGFGAMGMTLRTARRHTAALA